MNNLLAQAGSVINNPILSTDLQELLGTSNGGSTFFGRLIPSLISLTLVAGTIIFFFMLLLGGIQWITAGADKGALEGARSRLTSALIGIFIMFIAFTILTSVGCFFGMGLTSFEIGTLSVQITASPLCEGFGSGGPYVVGP